MKQVDQKVAIVTGAARGLGEAIARLFVAEGAQTIIADVNRDRGESLAANLGESASFEYLDVTLEENWVDVISRVVARFGRLDILVNNAAVIEIGSIETQSAEQWDLVNNVISKGTFFGCKHAVRSMKTTGGGSIVNVSSLASVQGEPYNVAYVAAKGAVESLTRSVAVHCAQSRLNIRCNSVHPGAIETPLMDEFPDKVAAAQKLGFEMLPNLGSANSYVAKAEEIAPSILYLASDAAKWVNGTRLMVDNTMSVTTGAVPG